MRFSLTPLPLILFVAVCGCTTATPEKIAPPPAATISTSTSSVERTELDALLAEAEQEVHRADAQGFLWLKTESYLADAKAARAAGDLDRAAAMARKALDEALLAQKQANQSAETRADYTYHQ